MISIQSSLSELDRCHQHRALAVECYRAAIRNVAQYAVELDAATTDPHRQYLTALAAELAEAQPGALDESRATLRGLLRDYRDRAARYLNGLRDQLKATARALQETVDALAQSDGDHSARMHEAMARLRRAADSDGGGTIRTVVLAAVDSIEDSLEKIHKQHQFTIAQFQTEISLLHGRVDSLEKAAAIDQATKFSNRRTIEEYLRSLPGGRAVLLAQVRGLAQAQARFGAALGDELVATFGRRLRNSLPKDAVVGRWNEQDFLVILPDGLAEDAVKAQAVANHLSMPYACMQAGKVVRFPMEVTVEFLGAGTADSPQGILERVIAAFGAV